MKNNKLLERIKALENENLELREEIDQKFEEINKILRRIKAQVNELELNSR